MNINQLKYSYIFFIIFNIQIIVTADFQSNKIPPVSNSNYAQVSYIILYLIKIILYRMKFYSQIVYVMKKFSQ